jgi:hypothetical protein
VGYFAPRRRRHHALSLVGEGCSGSFASFPKMLVTAHTPLSPGLHRREIRIMLARRLSHVSETMCARLHDRLTLTHCPSCAKRETHPLPPPCVLQRELDRSTHAGLPAGAGQPTCSGEGEDAGPGSEKGPFQPPPRHCLWCAKLTGPNRSRTEAAAKE